MITRIRPAMLALIAFLLCLHTASAASSSNSSSSSDSTRWITYQNADGQTVYLKDDRRPSLYTGNFGDCLGSSSVNVTRFDAAYYKDNMTVLFHLAGNSAIANESLMMYIGVYAYGESRFDLLFNPCAANIASLCPLNSSIPITASGIIPVAPSDVANIPSIALSIPDFEGEAILRIFANSTQTEIGCYSAVVTNGNSFKQPKSVGTVLGVFALVTLLASFATAIYGEAVPTMRLHYAHSLSVGVVIAVFQHIFFTGALSMNWPSVLVAWWSNFAWAGGMIYSETMQTSINHLIGNSIGNTSEVGAAPSDSTQDSLGGGYDISQIYKRALRSRAGMPANHPLKRNMVYELFNRDYSLSLRRDVVQQYAQEALQRRDGLVGKSNGYKWYGHPVPSGLPLPGNYSGFAGTLAEENIRLSNAFMTGFLWFLILLVIVVAAVVAFKWTLEGLARVKGIKQDRLSFFREHWIRYTTAVGLRTCYIAFFMLMFLTIFQFTYSSSGGVKGVAAIVFIIFLIGIPGAAAYALYYKTHLMGGDGNSRTHQDQRKKLLGLPIGKKIRSAQGPEQGHEQESEEKPSSKSLWKRIGSMASLTETSQQIDNIHDHDDYTMKFGWLASRFRRTRWWFFAVWIFYELLRAIFYGGASGHPLVQVFGLLVIEFLAFIYIIMVRPFEGRRLNVLVVYCLGFSKIASVALSAAFDIHFNLQRITTTVIGIVIIVIQGILTVITLIAVVVGAISSYMSVSRNHEDFRPRKWHGMREKYFDHLDRVANDLPREPKPKAEPKSKSKAKVRESKEEVKTGFEMRNMKRMHKIEDEDEEFAAEMQTQDPAASRTSFESRPFSPDDNALNRPKSRPKSGAATPNRGSRAPSVASFTQSNLPYGARQHRPSWSTRDFSPYGDDAAEQAYSPIDMNKNIDDDEPITPPVPSTSNFNVMKRRSRAKSAPKTPVRPQSSTDSLQVGGDVSTRDTIGKVPAPAVKPRANSNRHSSGTLYSVAGLDEVLDSSRGQSSRPKSEYGSRHAHPLTPAQELDEWTPKQSREGN